ALDPFQEQLALQLHPNEKLFGLEEGIKVNQALDVQAHLVTVVHGDEADEHLVARQHQLLLAAAGREKEVHGQVIHDEDVPFILTVCVKQGDFKAVRVQ